MTLTNNVSILEADVKKMFQKCNIVTYTRVLGLAVCYRPVLSSSTQSTLKNSKVSRTAAVPTIMNTSTISHSCS